MRASGICCGFNYRFGAFAAGDVGMLKEESSKYGIKVWVHDPVYCHGKVVSSTIIRRLIEEGNMETCTEFLGRPFTLNGKVEKGKHIGKKIGFPTANFPVNENIVLPPNGVYFTYIIINGKKYNGVTNIGVKPTVGKNSKNVETNIFNFDGNLYGTEIEVSFLKMKRREKCFESIDALKNQIYEDKKDAAKYHKNI